jgi:hypothetical protein
VLYREGAEAQHMYILLQGSLRHTALTTTVPEASELQAVDTLLPAPAPCSLLPAPCSLLTAPCSLLTAHYSLLTAHYSPHRPSRAAARAACMALPSAPRPSRRSRA